MEFPAQRKLYLRSKPLVKPRRGGTRLNLINSQLSFRTTTTSAMNSTIQSAARSVKEILDSKEFAATINSTTTQPLPPLNAKWTQSVLRLQCGEWPQLKQLEYEVWRFCHELYADPVHGRLLVIYGVNGTGKTHCAEAVYWWAKRTHLQYIARPDHINLLSADTVMWSWP